MKIKLIAYSILFITIASCKPTQYMGNYGQLNQTQVVLSSSNFNVLGSFTGIATENVVRLTIKDKEGLVSQAKANLLANAKASGVELTGSRTLVNVTVDIIQNGVKVAVTVSGEIIEFTE